MRKLPNIATNDNISGVGDESKTNAWDKSEREVTKFANTVTAILYKQGWRKEKDD